MAQFVRIGKDLVNLDQVQAMVETTHWEKPCVRILLAGEDNWLHYSGEDRQVLLAFMSQQQRLEELVEQEDQAVLLAEEQIDAERQLAREWATEHEE